MTELEKIMQMSGEELDKACYEKLHIMESDIDNAIKYTANNSGNVIVEASQSDVYVQVRISDMGVGIAAEDLSKVKEKFYKANNTVRGSGIGLAIADEIIKQHDGILLVDSKEGAGTTVTIVLTYVKPEPKTEIPEIEPVAETRKETENE